MVFQTTAPIDEFEPSSPIAVQAAEWAAYNGRSPRRKRADRSPIPSRAGEVLGRHAQQLSLPGLMARRIVTPSPADGIGPEIMEPTLEAPYENARRPSSSRSTCSAARRSTRRVALTDDVSTPAAADAVLLAAGAGRSGTRPDPQRPRPEQGLLGLPQGARAVRELRPVKPLPALYDAPPLKRELIEAPTCSCTGVDGGHLLR